jgi:hypothetical protein
MITNIETDTLVLKETTCQWWGMKRWLCGFKEYYDFFFNHDQYKPIDEERIFIKLDVNRVNIINSSDCVILPNCTKYEGNPYYGILCLPFGIIDRVCTSIFILFCSDIRTNDIQMSLEQRQTQQKFYLKYGYPDLTYNVEHCMVLNTASTHDAQCTRVAYKITDNCGYSRII